MSVDDYCPFEHELDRELFYKLTMQEICEYQIKATHPEWIAGGGMARYDRYIAISAAALREQGAVDTPRVQAYECN